jgi:hypothetical protein
MSEPDDENGHQERVEQSSPPTSPLLDRPVVVRIGDGRQLEFDGVQVIVRRQKSSANEQPGQEMIPLRQIVSVAVDHSNPPDRPNGALRIGLATGRTLTVEFRYGFVREVEQFQRAVSKGAALLQAPTVEVSRQVAEDLGRPIRHYGVWIFVAIMVALMLWLIL